MDCRKTLRDLRRSYDIRRSSVGSRNLAPAGGVQWSPGMDSPHTIGLFVAYKKSRLLMAGIIHNEIAASREPIPNAASTSLG